MILITFNFFLFPLLFTVKFCFCCCLVTKSGEGNGTPLQYSCLDSPRDWGAWWAAVSGVAKSPTWLSNFTFTFHFPALENEMATHSSVLAWRTPGTGEPGGLLSMVGSQSRTRLKWLSSSTPMLTAAFTTAKTWKQLGITLTEISWQILYGLTYMQYTEQK